MQDINEELMLIVGESATGKSLSLRNLPNPERVMYLNCEAGKRLPFKSKFKQFKVDDPWQVYEGFDHAQNNPDFDIIVIDTLTFLMDMFESKYIVGAADTMKGWLNYQQFFKNLMQDKVVKSDKAVIILAHTRSDLDEAKAEMVTAVPIKGALKNNGIEAYFSTVVAAKKVDIKELEKTASSMLTITDRERELGYKHVFQVQVTKKTRNERILSPFDMFEDNEIYMDNDAGKLLAHLRKYYSE